MAKPKRVYTLDEEMFAWIEGEETLKGPGRPSARAEAARKRQRYLHIRNIARKEIADLTRLARTLPRNQFVQIFRSKILRELTETLLWHPVVEKADPDLERARIAQLFIESGFNYLRYMKGNRVTLSHRRTIDEAVDLSVFLLESFKPDSEQSYSAGDTVKLYEE